MTGQLVYRGEQTFGAGHPSDSLIGELPDRSTRVTFELDNGAKLFFNDQRKFGWVKLIPTLEVPNIDFFKKVGPEPLAADFTVKDFHERLLRRKNSNIKAVLLDQTVIAGIGNIYADEGLWSAKIHPETLVRDISAAKIKLLYTSLRDVMNLSIEKGGSSDKNYVNAEGKKGSYLTFAKVFRREGNPCPRCGTFIIKTRVAGRGTHLCPHCQKEPKK
jgi:formamidopyrimidine-DNA glycosylase